MGTLSQRLRQVGAALALFIFTLVSSQAGLFDTWNYRMKVTFSGYSGGETLTNFPVLVAIDTTMAGSGYSRFASAAGNDLRFSTADGNTELPYQIDTWNVSGTSYIWVKVPALSSSSDYVYAYWGNSASAASAPAYTQNGTTWNSQFAGVYHFNENLANGGTTGVNSDSTPNGRHGTQHYTGYVTDGVVGGAQESDHANSSDDYVRLPGTVINPSSYTKEIWFRYDGVNPGAFFNGDGGKTSMGLTIGGDHFLTAGNTGEFTVQEATGYPTLAWHHCAVTYDSNVAGGTIKLFRNGTQVGSTVTGDAAAASPSDVYVFSTGSGWNAGGRGDEIRVSNVARSPVWLYATYLTTAANGSFQTYGTVEGSAPVSTNTGWSAYNDCGWVDTQGSGNFTTNSAAGVTSGFLKDSVSGANLGAQVSFIVGGATASMLSSIGGFATPPVGSDAYNTFNGKVHLDGYTFFGSAGGTAALDISGLDAAKRYNFVLYASRSLVPGTTYTNRSLNTIISDVGVFTNTSSSGTHIFTSSVANDGVRFNMGNEVGWVARYVGIDPGANGIISFDLNATDDTGTVVPQNVYINAFMIEETTGTSTNTGGGSTNVVSGGYEWRRGTAVFNETLGGSRSLYLYISNSAGQVYLDDVYVCAGSTAENGANLVLNGTFESGTTSWSLVGNHSISAVSTNFQHAGTSSLKLASTAVTPAGGSSDSVLQGVTGLTVGTHTLSVWYLATNAVDFVARFSSLADSAVLVSLPSSGTSTNTSVPTNPPVVVAPTFVLPIVMINEWMPFNRSYNTDNAGDRDPWLEIRNTTTTNINLQNWRLSDVLSNSSKFLFPAGFSLNAGAYMTLWIDGETSETSGGTLHANFRLNADGGDLALFDSTGTLVDAIEYGPQGSDTTGGQRPNGTLCDTTEPTPGAVNKVLQMSTASTTPSNGSIRVSMDSRMGHGYRIDYVTSMGSTLWQTLGSYIGNGSSMSTSLPVTTQSRYYRVVAVPAQSGYVDNTNNPSVLSALNNSSVNLIKSANLSITVGGSSGGSLDDMRNGQIGWETSNWYPDQLDGGRVRATWGSATTVDRVWLYGAGSIMQGIQRGRVRLSDGSVFDFGPIPDRTMVPGLEVSFPARAVTWVEIEITQSRNRSSTGAGGIGEWAIFNGMPSGVTHIDGMPRQVWHDTPPAGCTFPQSTTITGMVFTGRHIEYEGADTWYPTRGTNGFMYSCYADGFAQWVGVTCYGAESTPYQNTTTGNAKIQGNDPMDLKIWAMNPSSASTGPYHARYPAGSLIYNGVWFFGTYACNYNTKVFTDANGSHDLNWPYCGALCGFRYSSDYGQTWTDTSPYPRNGQMGLYDEPATFDGPVKFGTPHFVDLGENLEYSAGAYAYLAGHGTQNGQTNRFSGTADANVSWITGDGIFLSRIQAPTPATINNTASWQYFAGLSGTNATWTSDLNLAKPIAWWDNHMGCVTITYNPGLKKYLMCVTDGRYTCETMDSYVMESDTVYGPWKMVNYMAAFGEQAYFLNFPSKFISADGKKAWLSYSANFRGWPGGHPLIQPEASRYAWSMVEVEFLTAP